MTEWFVLAEKNRRLYFEPGETGDGKKWHHKAKNSIISIDYWFFKLDSWSFFRFFKEVDFFSGKLQKKHWKRTIHFSYVRKWMFFERKRSHSSKNQKFFRKKPCFLLFKTKNVVTSVGKHVKKLSSKNVRTPATSGFLTPMTGRKYLLCKTATTELSKSRSLCIIGKIRRRQKTLTTELNIFFEKVFCRKIRNLNHFLLYS